MKRFILFFLGAFPLQLVAQVIWQSDQTSVETPVFNVQSNGSSMLDDSFSFSLGGFIDGFVPTSANLSQWDEKWVELQSAEYREEERNFSNSTVLDNNDEPFRNANPSDPVYIWGRNGLDSGSEWILVSKASWKWPIKGNGSPLPGSGVSLQIADTTAEDVILGAVNNGPVHMQTAQVNFPVSYARWVVLNFSAGEASGESDDPDGDGRNNLLEYAAGSDPKIADAVPVLTITADRRLVIRRAANRAVTWGLVQSGNLNPFSALTSGFEMLSDEPNQLIFRLLNPPAGRSFYQATVTAN